MKISITCKYCGLAQLSWRLTADGWRLASRNAGIHHCDKRPTNQQEQQA